MNPEDRIRMLMEENAKLRAQLSERSDYGPDPESDPEGYAAMLESARRRQEQYGYFRKETPEERAGYAAGRMPPEFYDTYKKPDPAVQQMPYKGGKDEGPYIKKMPYKAGEEKGPYIQQMPYKQGGGSSSKNIRKL